MVNNLLEHEAYELFGKLGIHTQPWIYVDRDASPKLLSGRNYVAKIVARDILHKSDCGGLIFHVTDKTANEVHGKLVNKFGSAEGVLYVEEIEYIKSSEMLLGAHNDEFFGPLVTLGFGGTGTEFFNSVMKRGKSKVTFPASLSKDEVKNILSELPIVKMITGNVRGFSKLIELDEIIKTVSVFQSFIVSGYNGKEVEEVEINPLVCANGKIFALDGVCRLREKSVKTSKKPINKIESLINPKSACLVGASGKNPYSPANIILKNLLLAGIDRENVYLIHPKEESIEGIKCHPDLKSVINSRNGKPVDLLIVGVQAKIAALLIEESFNINAANSIQIISAGFGETEGGKELQRNLEAKLHELDKTPERRPVLNGPNTLGNIYNNLRTLFTSPKKSSGTNAGNSNVALICQSGAYMITAISNLADVVNPFVSISVGNQMDLTVVDCLEYLLEKKELKTFGLYIEGLKEDDGHRLMGLSKKAKEIGKFVVVYKAGRTKEGADAAKGHTAAMAGDYGLFEDLLTSSGAIVADTFVEFTNLLMMTSRLKPIKKNVPFQISALSNAGFEKCAIADHLMRSENPKFKLADYTKATKDQIRSIYEAHNVSGIMDVHEVLDLTPMMNDEGYEQMIRTTLNDPNVSFGIYSIVPETMMLNICEAGSNRKEDEKGILARLIKLWKETEKPFVVSMESGWKYDSFAKECLNAGIPCFRRVDAASRAVDKMLRSIL